MPRDFKGEVCLFHKKTVQAGTNRGAANEHRHVIKSSVQPDLTQSSGKHPRLKLFHKDAHWDDSELIVLRRHTRNGRLF